MEIKKIVQLYENLKSNRANFDNVYEDIHNYFMPHRGDFTTKDMTKGIAHDARYIHPIPLEALEKLTSRIITDLTDLALNKISIAVADKEVGEIDAVKRYADEVSRKMRSVFLSSASGFQSQNAMATNDLVGYGTGNLCVIKEDKYPFVSFRAKHISRMYIDEDHKGNIINVYELLCLSVKNLARKFGKDKLSDKLQSLLDKDPNEKVDVLRAVLLSDDAQELVGYSEPDLYTEFFIELDTAQLIESYPLSYLPDTVGRWEVKTGEMYGRSPAWIALPYAKQITALSVMKAKALQLALVAPVLTTDDGILPKTLLRPGSLIQGGIDEITGQDKLRPYRTGDNLQAGLVEEQQLISYLEKIFYSEKLPDNKNVRMTELEVQARLAQLRALSPNISRIISEYLNEIAKKVYHILDMQGQLPDMPVEMKNARLKFEFMGSLTKAFKVSELEAIQQTYQFAAIAGQFDPGVFSNFDHNNAVRHFAEISGTPLSLIRSQEDIAAEKEAMAAQQQALQQAQIGNLTADSIGKLVQ